MQTQEKRDDLAQPGGLTDKGAAAWRVLTTFLKAQGLTYTGGCRAFYSPTEWRARRESYGCDSILIVVYDGGEHRAAFASDEAQWHTAEAMQAQLASIGCFFEECTGWYGAVYVK